MKSFSGPLLFAAMLAVAGSPVQAQQCIGVLTLKVKADESMTLVPLQDSRSDFNSCYLEVSGADGYFGRYIGNPQDPSCKPMWGQLPINAQKKAPKEVRITFYSGSPSDFTLGFVRRFRLFADRRELRERDTPPFNWQGYGILTVKGNPGGTTGQSLVTTWSLESDNDPSPQTNGIRFSLVGNTMSLKY